MSAEFENDLRSMRNALDTSREELLSVLRSLSDGDLDQHRRGGWPVRRILEHLIQSEHIYSRLIVNLRGGEPSQEPLPSAPDTAATALQQEEAARRALLYAFEGVDEEAFYHLGKIGHEEYSVLSVLENEANHEQEHAAQVKAVLAAG